MGVDYYACECCGEAHYEEFVSPCASCGNSLCVEGLVNTEGVKDDGSYTYPYHGDDGIDPKYCPFCIGDIIDEAELLSYLAEKYGFDVSAEKEAFKADKKAKG